MRTQRAQDTGTREDTGNEACETREHIGNDRTKAQEHVR